MCKTRLSNDQFHTRANGGNERRRELVDYPIINVSRSSWTGFLEQHHSVIYIVCELKIENGIIEDIYRVENANRVTKLGQMGADATKGKDLKGLTVSQAFSERYTDLSATSYAWVLVGAIIFDKDRRNVHTSNLSNMKIDDEFRKWLVEQHDNLFSQPTQYENKEKIIGFDPFNSEHMNLLQEEAINFFDGKRYLARRSVFSLLPFQSFADKVCSNIDYAKLCNRYPIQQLLCSFTGSGKSHLSPYFSAKYVDPYTQIALFTTPVVKTMEDIKTAIKKYYYGVKFEIFDKERILREGDNLITIIEELQQQGILVVVLLSVQLLRRGEDVEDVKIGDLNIDDKERDLASKVFFLKEKNVGLWIRDERHMQYDGPITKTVLEHITPHILLDLTATPYREIQAGKYEHDEITSITLAEAQRLVIAKNPQMGGFPQLKIEAFNTNNSVVSVITEHCGYSVEELGDPRKWNAVDKWGNFLYPDQYLEFFRRAYCGSFLMGEYVFTYDRAKNPLELASDYELRTSCSDRVGLVVLPEGGCGLDAASRIDRICSLLNDDLVQKKKNNYYVSAYDKCWNRRSINRVISELLKEHKRVIVLTHRKFTTGVNIPQLGHIILLDTMGSINEFEQLLGRLFRKYTWDNGVSKTVAKMFVIGAGTELKAHIYHIAYAANKVNPKITVDEYYRCLPLTIHEKTLSCESIDIDVLERSYREITNRLRDGKYNTNLLVQEYATALKKIASSGYHDMGGDAGRINITITKKNGVKIRRSRNRFSKTKDEIDEENQELFGKKDGANRAAVLALMLNEINHIGFLMESSTVLDAFNVQQSETFFGYDNVTMALLALEDSKLLEDVEFGYREYCSRIRDLSFTEQADILFQNKEYKRMKGVVYVKQDLTEELCKRVSVDFKTVTNSEDLVIIVVNALSGIIPFQIRKMYSKARIICAEYFPHYIDYLRKMGFEVVDLKMRANNLTVEYMSSKLQRQIQKNGIACVLGNPPYQDPNNDGTKIFRDFMSVTMDSFIPSVPIAYITPNTWLSRGDEILSKVLRERSISFIDTRSQYIKDTYFPGVGSTFCWFILDQKTEIPTTLITYEGESHYNVDVLGFIPVENTAAKVRIQPTLFTLSILDKYLNFNGKCFEGGFTTAGGVGTRAQHSKESIATLRVPCYCSTVEDKNLHYIATKTGHHHQKKVLFVSSYLHNPAVRRARYCNQPVSTMNNIAYWIVDNDRDGSIVEEFCNSDFLKFIIFCLTSKRDVPIPIINSIKVPIALRKISIQEAFCLSNEEMETITTIVHINGKVKNKN